jgi:hypothetical protein
VLLLRDGGLDLVAVCVHEHTGCGVGGGTAFVSGAACWTQKTTDGEFGFWKDGKSLGRPPILLWLSGGGRRRMTKSSLERKIQGPVCSGGGLTGGTLTFG